MAYRLLVKQRQYRVPAGGRLLVFCAQSQQHSLGRTDINFLQYLIEPPLHQQGLAKAGQDLGGRQAQGRGPAPLLFRRQGVACIEIYPGQQDPGRRVARFALQHVFQLDDGRLQLSLLLVMPGLGHQLLAVLHALAAVQHQE